MPSNFLSHHSRPSQWFHWRALIWTSLLLIWASMVQARSPDKLVYSTLTSVHSTDLLGKGNSSFEAILRENEYLVEQFDMSQADGLLLFGRGSIIARPLK